MNSDLRPLKHWLQRGEIAELAHKVGISTRQATNIIKGRCTNWIFVEKLLARVDKNKALSEKGRLESVRWYEHTIKSLELEISNSRTTEHRRAQIERQLKKLRAALDDYCKP